MKETLFCRVLGMEIIFCRSARRVASLVVRSISGDCKLHGNKRTGRYKCRILKSDQKLENVGNFTKDDDKSFAYLRPS